MSDSFFCRSCLIIRPAKSGPATGLATILQDRESSKQPRPTLNEGDKCPVCGSIDTGVVGGSHTGGFPPDVADHFKKIKEMLNKDDLEVPSNVIATMLLASRADGLRRMELIMKAHVKAETFYYAEWAEGNIESKKKKGPPMPEDVKAMLRNKGKPTPINVEPLMKVTIKAVQNADPIILKNLYYEVYGAEAGSSLTAERMRASMISAIRELIDTKRRPKGPDDEYVPPTKVPSKPKQVRVPIYSDRAAQLDRESKYPWAITGSWRADPEHDGGTLVDIKCQSCGKSRTVHAGDLFQVRFCVGCKKASKPTAKAVGQ